MMKGYDIFFEKLGEVQERYCQVCGTKCKVKRDQLGATSYLGSLAKVKTPHDYFYCPYSDKDWHKQALELILAIEETPSKRIAELMQLDLIDLLEEHGIQLPK